MRRLDFEALRSLVRRTLQEDNLDGEFSDIQIDNDTDFTGSEYLRVFLIAAEGHHLTPAQLDTASSGITRAVGGEDERFASVFFPTLN